MSKTLNYDEIKQCVNDKKYELFGFERIKNHIKVIIKDYDGYFYYFYLENLRKNQKISKFDMGNPYTVQNIKLWCQLNNKLFKLISDIYESAHKKLQWECLKEECGEVFEMNWAHISQGKGCSYCNGKQVGLSNCLATRNPELATQWHPTLNGNLTPYDVTCGSTKEIYWKCNKNSKHEWKSKISDRNNGNGCPYCSGLYASEDYNLLVINPKLCEEWNYSKNKNKPENYTPGCNKKVWWKCKECNHEWDATINHRNNNRGCPECSKSYGEKSIEEVLNLNGFIEIKQNNFDKINQIIDYKYYIPQKTFDELLGVGGGLLSYDFCLPQYNLLIEYQGIQHEKYRKGFHKSKKDFLIQQEHDKRKHEYAKTNNIRLLEIWYWDFDRIEEILNKELNFK